MLDQELIAIIENALLNLNRVTNDDASLKSSPSKWSKKEIIGHLIDSASNNHQRFVRLGLEQKIELPNYEQDDWVALQHYNDREWQHLLKFWESYNKHLAFIIKHLPPTSLDNKIKIGDNAPVSLLFIIEDYISHLKHHLKQLSV